MTAEVVFGIFEKVDVEELCMEADEVAEERQDQSE